jgi:hypothetical protein
MAVPLPTVLMVLLLLLPLPLTEVLLPTLLPVVCLSR